MEYAFWFQCGLRRKNTEKFLINSTGVFTVIADSGLGLAKLYQDFVKRELLILTAEAKITDEIENYEVTMLQFNRIYP